MNKSMVVKREAGFPTAQGKFTKFQKLDGSIGLCFEPEFERETKFTGTIVDNTCGAIRGFENEIRIGIANGAMPEELEDIFKEVRAIVEWA